MSDLISRSALLDELPIVTKDRKVSLFGVVFDFVDMICNAPAVDAVEVVRCQNCIHAEPFDRNCELNSTAYMHCKILRGEETKNVWHKYKKYYKDYSVVDRDGFCDEGEPMDGERKGDDAD